MQFAESFNTNDSIVVQNGVIVDASHDPLANFLDIHRARVGVISVDQSNLLALDQRKKVQLLRLPHKLLDELGFIAATLDVGTRYAVLHCC